MNIKIIAETESKIYDQQSLKVREDVPKDIMKFLAGFAEDLQKTLDFSNSNHRALYSRFSMYTGIWREKGE